MKFIGYFFFIVIMAFQGWANARPPEFHCMMKEVAGHVQMQNCDEGQHKRHAETEAHECRAGRAHRAFQVLLQ